MAKVFPYRGSENHIIAFYIKKWEKTRFFALAIVVAFTPGGHPLYFIYTYIQNADYYTAKTLILHTIRVSTRTWAARGNVYKLTVVIRQL